MAPCQYTPPDGAPEERMTRLLKLHPSSDPSPPLVCDLFHARLGSCPFETISYYWGESPATPRAISCNESSFPLRINIFGVLFQFRSRNERDAPRILWVDALFINQKDTDEKNKQVRMMRDIYAKSERTLIRLGPESGNSREAFVFARGMLSIFPSTTLAYFHARIRMNPGCLTLLRNSSRRISGHTECQSQISRRAFRHAQNRRKGLVLAAYGSFRNLLCNRRSSRRKQHSILIQDPTNSDKTAAVVVVPSWTNRIFQVSSPAIRWESGTVNR
jgi:hypothetical protein